MIHGDGLQAQFAVMVFGEGSHLYTLGIWSKEIFSRCSLKRNDWCRYYNETIHIYVL